MNRGDTIFLSLMLLCFQYNVVPFVTSDSHRVIKNARENKKQMTEHVLSKNGSPFCESI
jgi:hypothetical protein